MPTRTWCVALLVIAAGCGPAVPPNFAEIQQTVFTPSCTFSVCHSGRNAAAGMQLTEGKAYDELVGVTSGERPEKLRVAPGDPDGSYLLDKLLKRDLPATCPNDFVTTAATDCANQMPRDGEQLDAAYIEGITSWITEGARE